MSARLDPSQWVVVVKKHPAEITRPNIPGVLFAPDDAHVHDLIDLSHSVMLLNSGVGLLSLAFGKPVLACGEAFYAAEGLASTARSVEEAFSMIQAGLPYDREAAYKFIRYLMTEFYSFGETIYIERDLGDRKFLAASRIKYQTIRKLTDAPVEFAYPPVEANVDSPLYSSFGGKDALDRARQAVNRPLAHHLRPAVKPEPRVAKPVSLFRRPLVPVVRPFVRLLGNKGDVSEFNQDPAWFFGKLKNPLYRGIGAILFPERPVNIPAE